MRLGATVLAVDAISSLPEEMCCMATVVLIERPVDTGTLDIGGEGFFIRPFVNALSTSGASEISFGFFKGVCTGGLLLCLFLKQAGDQLCPGGLALNWLVWAVHIRVCLIELDLGTRLLDAFLNGGGRQCLVNSDSTGTALIAASVRLPTVLGCLPRVGAELDKLLLVLLGVPPLMPVGLLMQVVFFILIHSGQASCSMGVDSFMVLIKGVLPVGSSFVLELGGTFPCRQCCISLASPEMWLAARCVWCACVAADVQDRDPVKVRVSETLIEVLMLCSVADVGPCLPDCCNLNNDFDCNAGMFGQGN